MTGKLDSKINILVVDDDEIIRQCLKSYLEEEGYRILTADSAERAEQQIALYDIDLILLDIRLPDKDGLTLTRELRVKSEIGIILVTGRQDDIERIIGLECGADDYIAKPFVTREILARAKNVIRRVRLIKSINTIDKKKQTCKVFDNWTLTIDRRILTNQKNEQTPLTEGEFKLLLTLINNSGHIMSRDQLMDQIKDREWCPNDRTVDVLVGRLRKKLGESSSTESVIKTIHGAGYLFTSLATETYL